MIKIYIAAASKDIARAELVRDQLRELEYDITSTWMDQIRQVGAANPRDASNEQRAIWAEGCLREVRNSDVLLFLVPDDGMDTAGAWTELGVAYAESVEILCAGVTKRSIFCALGREFASDQDAIHHIASTW